MKRLVATTVFALCAPLAPAAEPPASPVVASVGDTVIRASDLEREMLREAGGRPGAFESAEQRRALLDEMIHERMAVVAARKAGYAERPDIVAALDRLIAQRYREDQLGGDAPTIPDEDVQAYYEEHAAQYTIPARIEAALIRVDVPAGAAPERQQERRDRAAEVLQKAQALDLATRGFGPLAFDYSDDRASRYVGGVIGWLTEGRNYRWPKEVVQALFALEEPGQVGTVVEAQGALWIVRLVQRTDAVERPLSSVEGQIRHELEEQALRRAQERLQRKLAGAVPVEIDAAAFDAVAPPQVEDPRDTPPAPMASRTGASREETFP